MENRLFTYISGSKIDMLYNQGSSVISKEINAEIGGEISGKIAKVNGKVGRKEVKSVNIYRKLESVENNLNCANLIGGLCDNKPFIKGQAPLAYIWTGKAVVSWLYSYYDNNTHVYYNCLFYGSSHNIIGLEDYSYGWGGSDHDIFIYQAMKRIAKKRTPLKKMGLTIYDGMFWRLKKWEIVEYIRKDQGGFNFKNEVYNSNFLVRIDYRETIPIKRFNASKVTYYYNNNYKNSNPGLFDFEARDRALLKVPNETEYIVYVFGSPIYVEHVPKKENIHIIDGRPLLYFSDEGIKTFVDKKSGKINETNALEYISIKLCDAGLLKEEKQLKNEYWEAQRNNHYNNIGNEAFIKLVRQYTTPIPPL